MEKFIKPVYRFKLHIVLLIIILNNDPESFVIAGTGNNYEIRKETIMIPMRDGIKLSTDIFFPDNLNGKKPVILMRTPINKTSMGYIPYYFASQGYVVAI